MPFSELVEINPRVKLMKNQNYPFVEMGVVQPGKKLVKAGEVREYKGGGSKFFSRDTLFARITPCLENGKIAQFNSFKGDVGFGSTEFFVFRARSEISDPDYVYYLSISDYLRKPAERSMSGASGRQRADMNAIVNIEVPAPPLSTQRKIASILSAYDDLIENNLRRIKILEGMAWDLYREWFVKFRFPGHEKVRFVDSELGRVPEGWEIVPFTKVSDVLSGGTPTTKVEEFWNGKIPFFSPKDASNYYYVLKTAKTITESGLKKCNSRLYPKNTVFITARGTVGKVVMPATDMAMNQSCYALQGREGISQHYLFLAVKDKVDYLKKNTGGATFDTIVVETFERMLTVKPPHLLIEEFSRYAEPNFNLMLSLINKNETLRNTRDFLLPKLICGEIDVSELEIETKEEIPS